VTDYTKATGSTGTMKITDTGTTVEFWLKAGSGTYNYQLPWGYTINGVTNNNKEFRFEMGGAWQKLSAWTVSTSQTVTFRLFDTGTSGLGGPTTLSANISRSSAPAAPSPVVASNITSTSLHAAFTDGANNGAAIDSRQVGYAPYTPGVPGSPAPLPPTVPTVTLASDGSTDITGLTPGTIYYLWARTHNAKGYSPWSIRSQATTLRVPAAMPPATIYAMTQVSADIRFHVPSDNGGTPILEYQIGYATNSTGPSSTVTATPTVSNLISGLSPATQYYFWVRARNSVGWSSWSNPIGRKTVAGASVKVGAVWYPAVPYVKVAGIWKVARPWGRIMGVWKETI
jgi:hypothetical protein